MALDQYDIDTLVQFEVNFTNRINGSAVDPTEVLLFLRDPAGTQTSVSYSNNDIVRTGIGQYYYNKTLSIAGNWMYKFQGKGAVEITTPDVTFTVRATSFTDLTP